MSSGIGRVINKGSMEGSTSSPTIRVEIYNQTYNIRSDGDTEYIIQLAEFVDSRMREISSGTLTVDSLKVAILAALHIAVHGDGVRDIALRVSDARAAYEEALRRGAKSAQEPQEFEDGSGRFVRASIATYGDTVHSFIERQNYRGIFPGFKEIQNPPPAPDTGIAAIDHIVGNVELGQMNHWVAFYRDVLGFSQLTHFSDKDISTDYSALMSKVMQNGSGRIKFPINEPAEGKRRSQIEEYLIHYGGPGVQHIALATKDIIATVDALRTAGVDFLRVPETYYEDLPSRIGEIEEDYRELGRRGILVDRDEEGYLLQIFSQPVQDRPTVFYEVIRRHGSKGFGAGNFKALFEALEREQARRGNL